MIVAVAVYVISILMGFSFRKSKVVTLMLLLYSWCIFGLNTNTPDYISYYQIFNGTYYGKNIEIGFELINVFFRNLGLNFQQFRMIWALIYVGLIANFAKKVSGNPNCIISLMLICPILVDASAIRSSVAYLLVMNFSLLLRQQGWKRRLLFICGVILASTIHISCVFFLIFLLENFTLSKNKKKAVLFFVMVLAVIIKTPIFTMICQALYDMTGLYGIQKWLLGGSLNTKPNLVGFLSVAVFLIALVIISEFEAKYIVESCGEEERKSITLFLQRLSFHMLYLLPVLMLSIETQRFMYGSLLMFHSITSNCFSEEDSSSKFSLKAGLFVVLEVVVLLAMVWVYSYSYKSHDVYATLYCNYLFT